MPAASEFSVAADEVGPFVAVHADAVADAVGEVLVVGAEAGVGDDLAGGGVDGLAQDAGAGGGEGGGLGLVDDVEDAALLIVDRLFARLAIDEGAGDVGLVAFDGAAVVDEDDCLPREWSAVLPTRGVGRSTRRPGSWRRPVHRSACRPLGDELAELVVGHAGMG